LFSGTTADYCEVKHGRKEPERYHPIVDEITHLTKGCIIYQEQILQIVRVIGGFDWGHSIEIRRIISKKLGQAAFQVSMEAFVEGAERLHGIDRELAERIWKRLVTSGTYSFVNAHSVCYAMLAWWCAWLKVHYPAEFYAASLSKAKAEDAAFRLMKDAQRHGITISPPLPAQSNSRWSAVMPRSANPMVVAGWSAIPGMAAKTAEKIDAFGPFEDWSDLTAIRGIGPKKTEAWEAFCTSDDPFKLEYAKTVLGRTLDAIKSGEVPVPTPDHTGADLVTMDKYDTQLGVNRRGKRQSSWAKNSGSRIVYMGLVRSREYQNAAENERSRTGDELEDILARMKKPDLQDYCVLRCYDDGDEEVYVRTTRYTFPKFKTVLESVAVGHDIVVVRGRKSPGFGTSVFADEIFVIDPEE